MVSMTGYGYEELSSERAIIAVEIKSVNSRFLDLTINLPPHLSQLEGFFRARISDRLVRGKVDVFVRLREIESDAQVFADVGAARAYLSAIKKVAEATGYPLDIPLSLVISQPGVLNPSKSYDAEKYRSLIEPVFESALGKFLADTEREGANMKADLEAKLCRLEECALFFCEWQPKMEGYFRDTITKKFKELLGENADQNRIMTEVAAMLVKYTINEEVVRLQSHLKAIRQELNDNPYPGKKLDFLCQEANREINTIGSKNQFAQVGAMVVAAKDALENIREQSKNVA